MEPTIDVVIASEWSVTIKRWKAFIEKIFEIEKQKNGTEIVFQLSG